MDANRNLQKVLNVKLKKKKLPRKDGNNRLGKCHTEGTKWKVNMEKEVLVVWEHIQMETAAAK